MKKSAHKTNLKSCCIICSHSFSISDLEKKISSPDDGPQQRHGNNFTHFCDEIAAKTTGGIMEVAGITMAPRLLLASSNNKVKSSPKLPVCENCLDDIGQVVDQKEKTQEVELQVISLQIQLLETLKQLKDEMDLYSVQMSQVENSVRSSNMTRLNTHLTKLEKEGRTGVGAVVWQLRDGILDVSGELRDYQDDLSGKVCCNGEMDSRADPLNFAVVKIDVMEKGEAVMDEHLLQQQDFLAAEDLEEIARTQDKSTQTSGTYTSAEGLPAPFRKTKARRSVFQSRKRAKLMSAVARGKGTLEELINKYACDKCSDRFSSKSTLESHHVKKHGARKLKCKKCGKKFLNDASLNGHMENMHNARNDPELEMLESPVFECHLCPKVFSTQRQLTGHISSNHDAGQKRKKRGTDTESSDDDDDDSDSGTDTDSD